jgi:hypothetical protein
LAPINYVTIVRPDTGERIRLKGNLFREHFCSRDLQRTPHRYDPAQLLTLERRLERLVEKRANYHRARYGVEEQPVAPAQSREQPIYDGTRNPTPQRLQTIGTTIPPARSTAGEYTGRFVEAAHGWCRANCELELATDRFERANGAFANSIEPALIVPAVRRRIVVSPYQYPAPIAAARTVALHDHDADMEPEMELDFP